MITNKTREREARKRAEAIAVLRHLPDGPPGAGVVRLAELAFGSDALRLCGRVRLALSRIIYDLHIRIRRRRGDHGYTQYWFEPADRSVREAILQGSETTATTTES